MTGHDSRNWSQGRLSTSSRLSNPHSVDRLDRRRRKPADDDGSRRTARRNDDDDDGGDDDDETDGVDDDDDARARGWDGATRASV